MSGAYGVKNSLKFFADLGDTVVDVLGVVKAYQSSGLWGVMSKIAPLMAEVAVIVVDAKASLPELAELDAEEALQIGAAAYSAIQKIVAAA